MPKKVSHLLHCAHSLSMGCVCTTKVDVAVLELFSTDTAVSVHDMVALALIALLLFAPHASGDLY